MIANSFESTNEWVLVLFQYLLLIGNFLYPGADNLENLKKLAAQFQKQEPGSGTAAAAAREDDDDVPDLVPGETFEAAAGEKPAA